MMSGLLATAQLIIIIVICLYEYQRKSASFFLWAMCLIMFGFVHFSIVLSGNSEYPEWVLNNASLFVIGFCSIYLSTRFIILRNKQAIRLDTKAFKGKWFGKAEPLNSVDKSFIRLLSIALIVCVGYISYTLISLSGGILSTSWGTYYLYYSGEDYFSFSKIIYIFFLPSATLFFVAAVSKRTKLMIVSALIILLFVMISRNKADLLPVLCGVIALYVYRKGTLSFKNTVALILLGCVSVFIVYSIQLYRHIGSLNDFITTFSLAEFTNHIIDNITSGEGELGLLKVFYHFVYINNDFPGFGEGHTYIRLLLVLVPTGFAFGLKPNDFAITMGSAWVNDPSNTAFSTHPTLFGDVYANLGNFGVLLGIFWAVLVYGIDKLIDRNNVYVKLALLNLITGNYVLIGRGSVYNSFTSIVYGSIIIGGIYLIARIKLTRSPRREEQEYVHSRMNS